MAEPLGTPLGEQPMSNIVSLGDFEVCPACGKRGLHHHRGVVVSLGNCNTGTPPGKRCKRCQHSIPDYTALEYHRLINHTTDALESPDEAAV